MAFNASTPNNDALLNDLSEDEAASLNGGRYCRYIYLWRRVCYWYGCFTRRVLVWRCYY